MTEFISIFFDAFMVSGDTPNGKKHLVWWGKFFLLTFLYILFGYFCVQEFFMKYESL